MFKKFSRKQQQQALFENYILRKPKKSLIIFATFAWILVIENFQELSNLVTLCNFYALLFRETSVDMLQSYQLLAIRYILLYLSMLLYLDS